MNLPSVCFSKSADSANTLSPKATPVVPVNANGAESSNRKGVVEIRGDQPTGHWLWNSRPRAELSSRASVPQACAPELLCGGAVAIAEQAPQSPTTSPRSHGGRRRILRVGERVPEPLMVALSMIMTHTRARSRTTVRTIARSSGSDRGRLVSAVALVSALSTALAKLDLLRAG